MKTISLFSLTIYPYGLALAVSAFFCFLLMQHRSRLKAGSVSWFALFAVPLGLLGGRLGYFLVSLTWFMDRGVGTFFRLNEGGYMLYGVMAGLVLAAWLTGRMTRQPAPAVLDEAAAPFALFTALARAAEFFSGTGLGDYVDEWFDPMLERTSFPMEDPSFFQRFPFAVQDRYGFWCFSVFLLEALAALVIFILLFQVSVRRTGTKSLLFLVLYASLQTFLESLRIDLELRWGFVKVNQLLALPALLIVFFCCLFRSKDRKAALRSLWPSLSGMLAMCGVVMLMEFALEKKIPFLTWMRMDLCWAVMGLASVCMGVIGWKMVMKNDARFEPDAAVVK